MDQNSWLRNAVPVPSADDRDMEDLARPAVLVIEDEPDILDLLVVLLSQAGFRAVSTRTAEEGLEHLREQTFDLVLADYALPNRSGGWMLSQASAEGLLDGIPVLVVTAHPQPHGLDRYEIIRKPFDLDQLVDRVKQRLVGGPARPRRSRAAGASAGHSANDDSRMRDHRPPIELILYISAHSPRSVTAIDNVRRAVSRFRSSRVKLTICDLAVDPGSGNADSVAFTPTLVKRSPGPRTFILGHLTSPDLLLELLDGCES